VARLPWLNREFTEKLCRRKGSGRRLDPYQYRLSNEDDDYYDRSKLPPLRDILPPASDEEVRRPQVTEILTCRWSAFAASNPWRVIDSG
jgi:hypothetical protein